MSDIIERSDHQEERVDSNDDVVSQLGVRIQQMSGPPWLSFADKFTSDHISTALGHLGRSQEIDSDERKEAHRERLVYVGIGAALFVFLTIFILPENQQIYSQILEWVGLFVAGGLGGYGLGIRRNRSITSSDH